MGVEQYIMELNGWAGKAENKVKPVLSNKINATVQDIYKQLGKAWLDANIPNWQQAFKFNK